MESCIAPWATYHHMHISSILPLMQQLYHAQYTAYTGKEIQILIFVYLSLSPYRSTASSLTSEIASISCLLEIFSGMLLLVDLGFDRETLIFQLRYLSNLIG